MALDQELLLKLASKSDILIDAATKMGVAYVGYQANKHWSGALTGLIALRLANSPNLAAGVSGVATLGILGLTNVVQQVQAGTTDTGGDAPIWKFLSSTLFPESPVDPGTQVPYNPRGLR